MRLRDTVILTRFLFVFFLRQVVGRGILSNRAIRWSVAAIYVFWMIASSALAAMFLRPLGDDRLTWRLVLDVGTVSIVLWVMVAFLLVKVLFLNADGLMLLTTHLPVTSEVRAFAYATYEGAVVLIAGASGVASVSVAALVTLGPGAVGALTASFVLPGMVTYAATALLWVVLERVFALIRLGRVSHMLGIVVTFVLIGLYSARTTALVVAISDSYGAVKPPPLWITTFSRISASYGAWAAILVGSAAFVVLIGSAILLTPRYRLGQSRFVPVPLGPFSRTRLAPQLAFVLRSRQTALAVLVSAGCFVFLMLGRAANPLWSLCLLPTSGLYQFASGRLPVLEQFTPRSAFRTYGGMLGSQLIGVAILAIPAIAVAGLMAPAWLTDAPTILLAMGSAILSCLLIGVVFPSSRDNPFSVMVGFVAVGMVLIVVTTGFSLLQLPSVAVAVMSDLVHGGIVYYSILGIAAHDRKARHEIRTANRQLRPDRRCDLSDHLHDGAVTGDVQHPG
jgi:hypothetical protein